MKRQQDRDTPPKGKRARLSYGSNDDNMRDRMSPDTDRREGRGGKLLGREPKSYRPERVERDRIDHPRDFDMDQDRIPKRHKDDRGMMGDGYGHMSRAQERERLANFGGQEYRTLMLSNFNGPTSDAVVRDAIFKEFKKFGEFHFKIGHLGDDRVVYLQFRLPEDARDAKHARQTKLVLFERPVRIEVVYPNKQRPRSASAEFNLPGDNFSNRSASPPLQGVIRRGVQHGPMGHDVGFIPRGGGSCVGGGVADRTHYNDPFYGGGRPVHNQITGLKPKFPDHLTHILPEDDDKATRTLFVGNLDHNIGEHDLKRIFERYGVVEDVDVKRPMKGQGNAYAFVKFINLDMAHKAKVDMSGQHIGKFQCKIGYGKVSPSTCLWVGGLGPWIQTETLEREFDRFGAIHRIVWPNEKTYAYVLYDSLDAAQAACQEMRGFHIGGTDKRLRVDFADEAHIDQLTCPGSPHRGPFARDERIDPFVNDSIFGNKDIPDRGMLNENWGYEQKSGFHNDRPNNRNRGNNRKNNWQGERHDNFRSLDNPGDNQEFNRFNRRDNMDHNDNFERQGRPSRGGFGNSNRGFQGGGRGRGGSHCNQSLEHNFGDQIITHQDRERGNNAHDMPPMNGKRRRYTSPPRGGGGGDGNDQEHIPHERDLNSEDPDLNNRTRLGSHPDRGLSQQMASVVHVDNVVDLAKVLPVVWSGALVLKNSAFAARMHIVSGAVNLVDTLMRDTTTTEMPVLRITQRLRLDQPKLEEVGRRVLTCGPNGHSVLLAKPGSTQALEDSNTMNSNSQMQQRPLKNLVSYLKQKEAAGVITLPPNPKGRDTSTGVLYAFPPCQFALDFLLKCAPKLAADPSNKEDHLVVVVVRAEG